MYFKMYLNFVSTIIVLAFASDAYANESFSFRQIFLGLDTETRQLVHIATCIKVKEKWSCEVDALELNTAKSKSFKCEVIFWDDLAIDEDSKVRNGTFTLNGRGGTFTFNKNTMSRVFDSGETIVMQPTTEVSAGGCSKFTLK